MAECAFCGGEIYRGDAVFHTRFGLVHDFCLCDILREMELRRSHEPGICAHCGEWADFDAVLLEGETLHDDCVFAYVRGNFFSVDYEP